MRQVWAITWARTGEIYTGKEFSSDTEYFAIYGNRVEALKVIEELSAIYKGQPIGLIECYITPITMNG